MSSPKERRALAVVLAAGEGTRMRTSLPKALHAIGGRTLLAHVLGAVSGADIALVVGPDHGALEAAAKTLVPDAPEAFTSEEGWKLDPAQMALARPAIAAIKALGCRVVLFTDPDP